MSNRIIIGYGRPRVVVVGIKSFSLPRLNQDGLDIIPQRNLKVKENLSGKRILKRKGFRNLFRLHYTRFITGDACLDIQEFLELEEDGHQLILYPREMNLMYNFNVYCSNSEFLLKIMRGDAVARGMKGLMLEFTEIEPHKKLKWTGISNINNLQENLI